MVLRIFKAVFIASLVALLVFSTWFMFEIYTTSKELPQEIVFEVEMGKGAEAIARDLKEKGVIKKEWPFLMGYQLFFSPESLKAGEYVFSLPLSTKEVLRMLTEGQVYLHPLTIPEGLTGLEISELLDSLNFAEDDDFREAFSQKEAISSWDEEAQNLEGYLFPETYFFPKGTPAKEIVSNMISQFKDIFREEWKRRALEMDLSLREVVILASLVEKETSILEEKKLVSAVFHNRLRRRMKLDCDPTIIYVLKQEGRFTGRLRYKDLKLDTPYNTYLYPGLPPGPICNPGRASLQAALYPADEDFLYFVSKNDGSHQFSRTYKEHQRAVLIYQKRRR
jgi:UPF0755 protein